MALEKLISADSHVVEPPDLWQTRTDAKFRDRAPRVVSKGDVDNWIVDEDILIGSIGGPTQAGRRYTDLENLEIEGSYEEIPAAAYDPHERLKAMEVDGVVGELVYSTIGTRLFTVDVRGELLSACFRALNDWSAEFGQAYPDRLKGTGVISFDDIDDAISELQRCAGMGLAGLVIPAYVSEDRYYDQPEFEPFWAAAQDAGLPIGMHSGSVRPGPGRIGAFANNAAITGTSAFRATQDYWVRRSVASMIFGGVFERYPRLKVGVVEYELAWAPYFIKQMDMAYKEHRYVTEIKFKGDKLPSDVFHENLFVCFQEDELGIALREVIGVDNIMFGSDYPHRESTWPNSRKVLAKVLKGVPEEEQEKIVYSNAARLYGFN
ncbi:MAG: amidohydrolase family protein [Dehalococcoidia bacterium]